jgi:hypothetical protein
LGFLVLKINHLAALPATAYVTRFANCLHLTGMNVKSVEDQFTSECFFLYFNFLFLRKNVLNFFL